MNYLFAAVWLLHIVTLFVVSRSVRGHRDVRLTARLTLWGWGLLLALVVFTYFAFFLGDFGVPGGGSLATFAAGVYWVCLFLLFVWLLISNLLHVGVTLGVLLTQGPEHRSLPALLQSDPEWCDRGDDARALARKLDHRDPPTLGGRTRSISQL